MFENSIGGLISSESDIYLPTAWNFTARWFFLLETELGLWINPLFHIYSSLSDVQQGFALLALECLFGVILMTWEGKR